MFKCNNNNYNYNNNNNNNNNDNDNNNNNNYNDNDNDNNIIMILNKKLIIMICKLCKAPNPQIHSNAQGALVKQTKKRSVHTIYEYI